MSENRTDCQLAEISERDAVVMRLESMVNELQLLRRKLWAAKSSGNERVADRVSSAVLSLSVDIRKVQVDAWMDGVNVFISYDTNGLPIRVQSQSRMEIVG